MAASLQHTASASALCEAIILPLRLRRSGHKQRADLAGGLAGRAADAAPTAWKTSAAWRAGVDG
ncbi:hypothetical protein OHA74_13500 [Streptomyces phaeochromogenes]|uniref:hypothetical protein n=1 Tax=Streptomyces phaeochromogenes TaxID=1923 RepID=UPI002E2B1C34|nr:hypothetical protein [Streptomyces phaeochromogenes]